MRWLPTAVYGCPADWLRTGRESEAAKYLNIGGLCRGNEQVSNYYPFCGFRALETMPGSYMICPVCFQEGNGLQFAPPAMAGGANWVSLCT
ncbi:CPCC family cysteine-rich protein [Streptomyces rubiginosohelvolus]|uniref:CPCC family cysteine-rich protein n=1 Tax=Streptomyces rubiginosohelvolus TaxID=67362 RepID=UPI00367CEC11